MTASSRTAKTHQFKVDPNVIKLLITGQSGSLQKAMMEAVANSMDAGATGVDIQVSPQRVVIQDNGKGIGSLDEMEKVFATFAFNHASEERTHGRFGVGRGQLFRYGKNIWRTNTFSMLVDVEVLGYDNYELDEKLKNEPGMRIGIDLYKPLTVREAYDLEEAFRALVKFSILPVTYNGKLISNDPREAKWTLETDEAWFNLRREGGLRIYSQGLFVEMSHSYGVGGDLVTKPGKALEVNIARNDINKDSCVIWPIIQKTLRAQARTFADRGLRQNTLTGSQRREMAMEALESKTSWTF